MRVCRAVPDRGLRVARAHGEVDERANAESSGARGAEVAAAAFKNQPKNASQMPAVALLPCAKARPSPIAIKSQPIACPPSDAQRVALSRSPVADQSAARTARPPSSG